MRVLFLRFTKIRWERGSQSIHRATEVIMSLTRHLLPVALPVPVMIALWVGAVIVVAVAVAVAAVAEVQGLGLECRDLTKGRFALAKSRIKGRHRAEGRIEAKGRIEGLCRAKGRIPETSGAKHVDLCPQHQPDPRPGRCIAIPIPSPKWDRQRWRGFGRGSHV